MPDHFCHPDLHSNTSESSAGELPVAHCSLWVWVMHRHARERIPPLTSLSPQEECRAAFIQCTHATLSLGITFCNYLWSLGEGDAKEELMVLRELEREGSMEIISISILLLPENGDSLALTSLKYPFKKGIFFLLHSKQTV